MPVNRELAELAAEYRAALDDFLAGAGEEALRRGYEVGRRAIGAGLGLLEMATLQEEALEAVLRRTPGATAAAAPRAFAFFAEALAPFEMVLRGFRDAVPTLRRLNEALESKNAELAQARDEAERRADDLARAQGQLVQAEKLAALGQLVAGVAHEVNNPLSFVINNLAVLQRDVKNLHDLLRLYQGADEAIGAARPETLAQIRALAARFDLDYAMAHIEELQLRSRDGLRRIRQIVLDLRNFARLDTGDYQEADLNAGIESTLNIIRGRAREQGVELHRDLSPLPPVRCYPAKINQVVLNLLVNAIDACAAGGQVTVRTSLGAGPGPDADAVEIHVLDTGTGIRPEDRGRIFDPFFTTKPPGKGTGLGLSISHGIVAEHGGRIEVESVPGKGAHFTVRLPLGPPPAAGS